MPGEVALRQAEQNALSRSEPSFYTGNGRGNDDKKGKLKGKKASMLALGVLAIFFVVTAVILSATEALLPGALEANVTAETDTQAASSTKRGLIIMSGMLENGFAPENNSRASTDWTSRYDYLTDYMAERFEKNNIEVSDDGKTLTWEGNTITSSTLSDFYYSNPSFRTDYTNATLGRAANYYDTSANTSFSKSGNSRNLFKDFVQTNNQNEDETQFTDTVNEKFDGDNTENTIKYNKEVLHKIYCDDGEGGEYLCETYYTYEEDTTTIDSLIEATTSISEAESKARTFISANPAVGIGKVAPHISWACTALQTSNMLISAISSSTNYQVMNYFLSYMENVSKMKAGFGDESGINETLNHLTTNTTSTVVDYDSVQWNPGYTEEKVIWPAYTYSINGTAYRNEAKDITEHLWHVNPTTFSTYTVDGSMLDSVGMQMLLAGAESVGTSNAITQATKDYSISALSDTISRLFSKVDASLLEGCTFEKPEDIVTALGANLPGGIAGMISGFIANNVLQGILEDSKNFYNIILDSFLAFMVPSISTFLFTSIPETLTGVAGGNAWAAGASAANSYWLGRNAAAQSLASKGVINAYNRENQELLALEAEMDRVNRSPFDATSKNTFLGSIVYSILPITARTTATNSISTLTRLTSNSIASLMGSVSAAGEGTSFMTTYGDCDKLEKIGAACNALGVGTMTTDPTTINLSTKDSNYTNAVNKNIDRNGNIKEGSNLANYVSYCMNRTSSFGDIDANILQEIQESKKNDSIIKRFLRGAPIIKNIVSAIEGFLGSKELDEKDVKWARGDYCVNNPETNELWDSEIKYYQRYLEDVRKLDQYGSFGDSTIPTLAYQEKYEAEHPWTTDNSMAGYLARIAGITKDDAELLLDVIEYYDYISKYDPDTRLAFTENTSKIKNFSEVINETKGQKIWVEHESQEETSIIAEHAVYADVRNRSYAI